MRNGKTLLTNALAVCLIASAFLLSKPAQAQRLYAVWTQCQFYKCYLPLKFPSPQEVCNYYKPAGTLTDLGAGEYMCVNRPGYPNYHIGELCTVDPADTCGGPLPQLLTLTVAPGITKIPTTSRVLDGHVLTENEVTLTVQRGGQPEVGASVGLQSDRGAIDTIDASKPTNANGVTTAKVQTRDQSVISKIGAANPAAFDRVSPGTISWLPATYESEFLVTCYVTASEADYSPASTVSQVCGLPAQKTYRSGFIADVKMQGSGVALDGQIIHYRGGGCFNTDSCSRTSTGACATAGTTIAVDRSIIPRRVTVNVGILGRRIAQDSGGGINGYHIDDYMGTQRAVCRSLGRRNSPIDFVNY